ncbi:MAG: DUF2807 domain-containing protein, partial [Pedobacter sp.]|nr:DUF2807 domain-containing protein [Chitinophagaceae bacterium]
MKNILLVIIVAAFFANCNMRTVKGSGVLTTEVRTVSNAEKIKSMGSFNVEITPGATTSVKIEGDDNLVKHIITESRNGVLVIKIEDH